MGTTNNKKPQPTPAANLTKEERLAKAREYAKQFKFEAITAEELKKMRRNAYAYLL